MATNRKGNGAKKPRSPARSELAATSATFSALPDDVRMIAAKISAIPGVVGVFFGTGRRERKWVRPETLSVHVRWKRPIGELPAKERIPPKFGGHEIDVIEVGHPSVDGLDHADAVFVDGARRSTITAIGKDGSRTIALLSGHGTLPIRDDKIVRTFEGIQSDARIDVRDNVGVMLTGRIVGGRIGEDLPLDFALAEFEQNVNSNTHHLAVGRSSPYKLRGSPLVAGESLFHYSSMRDRRIQGAFRQAAAAPLALRLPDNGIARYTDVLVVGNEAGVRFSKSGDSGSLVVDSENRVVGSVLGSSIVAGVAYVLGVDALESFLRSDFALLFKRTS